MADRSSGDAKVMAVAEESVSDGAERKGESEDAQRLQQLRSAEEALQKARDELARREKDIREKAQDLKALTEGVMKREEELAGREKDVERKENELLRNSPSAAAAAIESRTRALDEREKKVSADARNLKVFAEQLMKREEEYNIRVKSFNEEAEVELRGRVEELARRERDAVRKDQDAKALSEETSRREQELAKMEKEASDRLDEVLRREQGAKEAAEAGPSPGELENRKNELDALKEKLRLKDEELQSRAAQFAAHEEQLRAMEDELKRREEEWKAFSQQSASKDRELNARDEELRKKEQEHAARSAAVKAKEEELAAKGALALEKAALDDQNVELDAKREENRIRAKELKIREDEAERREVEIKEREDRMARLFSGAGAAGKPLTEEDRSRIMNDLAARDQEFQAKQEEARNAARAAKDELDARERSLADRETKLQDEAGKLKTMATGFLEKGEELQAREEGLKQGLEALADKERIAKELDERAQVLGDRERAVEQFNQELLALDAIIQKKGAEQAAMDKLLTERGEAVERETEALESDKEQLARDMEAHSSEKEALSARTAELEAAQKALAEKEAVLKSEEEKMAQLGAEVNRNLEEIQELEKDLKHKEIHLLTLEEEIKDCPYCSAKDGFVTTMQAIAEAKALGADVTDAERLFKQANIALETSSYEGAVQYNRKAMVLAREAKQKYLVHGVSYILSGAKRAVQAAANTGVDVTEPEALLKSAQLSLEKKDYENAEQLARRAERSSILAEDKAHELADRLDRVGKRLDEISAYGVELGEAQAAVQAARDLMKDRKQSDARKALEGVEEMAFLAFRRQATKLMEEARESISMQKAAGADLSDAELFFAKAEERLAEGDYGKCIQCTREALRLASEARPLSPEGRAPAEGAGMRRGRSRPRVVASTVRILTPGTASHAAPAVLPGATMPQAPSGPAPSIAIPVGPVPGTGAVTQSMMDHSPRGIPLQIPPGGGIPKDYQCPSCHGYFTVEDQRRPVLTKCPSCTTMVRLA